MILMRLAISIFGLAMLGYEVDYEAVKMALQEKADNGGDAGKDYTGKDKAPKLPPEPGPGAEGALPGGPEGLNPV